MVNNRLQKIIKESQPNFANWTNSINLHTDLIFNDNPTEDTAQSFEITTQAVNTFASIFEAVKKYGRFKDEWDYSNFYQNVDGFDLIIKSKKLRSPFYFGTDKTGIYLRTELNNEKNLKHMKDDFWKKLLSLAESEGFRFEQYEHSSYETTKQYPELFKSYTSMMFLIFRKYFFDAIDKNHHNEEIGSLGEFRITWNDKKPLDVILEEICIRFKTFYELKYALWKIDNLKHKS